MVRYVNVIIDKQKIKVNVAKTLKEKLVGLSFKKNITEGLLIPNCNHIHTFLMRENIDVLFLDERNRVIYKYQNMPIKRSFKVYEDINKTSVLELPFNTSKKIKIGDILVFESE